MSNSRSISPAVERLVTRLADSFNEYHSDSKLQGAWVRELVDAVRSDERDRCARLAEEGGLVELARLIRE